MQIIKEFKTFALKGNVVQLAVGVIVGAAFGKIVNSFVSDILMPPLGLLLGNVDFKDFKMLLKGPGLDDAGNVTPPVFLTYGNFIQVIFEFIIIAAAVFFLIKFINKFTYKEEAKESSGPPERNVVLLTEIRDLLRTKSLN